MFLNVFLSVNGPQLLREVHIMPLTMCLVTCHHLLGDDVHSQSEGRGHKEAAWLSNHRDSSRSGEVQVHHRHDCTIDLPKRWQQFAIYIRNTSQ